MSQTHAHCAIIKVKSAFWASHVPRVTLITAQRQYKSYDIDSKRIWNDLPIFLCFADDLGYLRNLLKTHMFWFAGLRQQTQINGDRQTDDLVIAQSSLSTEWGGV